MNIKNMALYGFRGLLIEWADGSITHRNQTVSQRSPMLCNDQAVTGEGGVGCPDCESSQIIKRRYDGKQRACQRYQCKPCGKRFDDLSGTVLSGHHQPLSVRVLCLYFMGLNLSNRQIAQELDLNKDDLQYMAEHLRTGIDKKNSR